MIMDRSIIQRDLIATLLVLLLSSVNVSGQEVTNNTVDPAERRHMLVTKLESLKVEQDFLRFKRAFYETDSKYLVLDLAAGRGMMMYRNRILRMFSLEKMNSKAGTPERGVFMMTGKIDGSSKRRALIFGNSLSLHGKKADAGQLKHAGYRIGAKDLAALFYALETGAKAFVK